MENRYLQRKIETDLQEKMVFIGGPRQVGKTFLSKQIGARAYGGQYAYYNWDSPADRRAILDQVFPGDKRLVVFDEIHKYRQWKNYLKGLFDTVKSGQHFLITGSARLDVYRRGGDSLFGRYHYYRLHPFSLAEAVGKESVPEPFAALEFLPSDAAARQAVADLRDYGGFPEPFVKKQAAVWRRFQNERLDRVIKEDIRDLESVRNLSGLQVLVELLPKKVGSLLSVSALTEDLQVSYKTAAHWLDILERFYVHYRIRPFATRLIASLRKQPKAYLWDWSAVPTIPERLENMVASHLLKFAHFLHDALGYKAELYFLRDVEGREVDFLFAVDQKPWFAVEVKTSDRTPSPSLVYFGDRLRIPFLYQVVADAGIDEWHKQVRVLGIEKFLGGLI